jgi:hypothetical protein
MGGHLPKNAGPVPESVVALSYQATGKIAGKQGCHIAKRSIERLRLQTLCRVGG